MRELAGITAKVKGKQYDGAMIIKAVWQKENLPDNSEPIIVKENRKMLVCKAIYGGESLTVTMLLNHQVPEFSLQANEVNEQIKTEENNALGQKFDEKRIMDFVTDVGDTNPIHRTKNPVVPGLLLMEVIKESLPVSISRLELAFRNAVFSNDSLNLAITGNDIRLHGREDFVTGNFA